MHGNSFMLSSNICQNLLNQGSLYLAVIWGIKRIIWRIIKQERAVAAWRTVYGKAKVVGGSGLFYGSSVRCVNTPILRDSQEYWVEETLFNMDDGFSLSIIWILKQRLIHTLPPVPPPTDTYPWLRRLEILLQIYLSYI